MGDETSRRTRQLLLEELAKVTDKSIEDCKERDDTLTGLDAVREALRREQLQVRVYDGGVVAHLNTPLGIESQEHECLQSGAVAVALEQVVALL